MTFSEKPRVPDFNFQKFDPAEVIFWKQRFLELATDPLDGMWLAFAANADHWLISLEDKSVGYCIVNPENELLQFFVDDSDHAAVCFGQALVALKVQAAVVSTCEPANLDLCNNHTSAPGVEIALMYHVRKDTPIDNPRFPSGSEIRLLTSAELMMAVAFAESAIGADSEWLRNYYARLIDRTELFGLWQGDELIATGECRPSELQPPAADVGMIVGSEHRGQGIATNILRWLIRYCHQRGLTAICSTESSNKAAQRAINNAGFVEYHKILEFKFSSGHE